MLSAREGCLTVTAHERAQLLHTHIRKCVRQQCYRNSPGLLNGVVTTDQSEWTQASSALSNQSIREQKFSSPDGPIRAVSGTIKGDAQNRIHEVVFQHSSDHMGMVVLHSHRFTGLLTGPV